MATTAEQIAALEAAVAKGVLEVQTGDRRVKYASPADLLDALARLQSQANTASGARGFRINPFKGASL